MDKAKKILDIMVKDGALTGWLALLTSIALLVTSFIIPPTGQIDPSVLQGVGELFAFATLFKLPNIIQSIKDGKSLSVKHGSTEVTLTSEKEDEAES